ncbi:MAG: hypothetical protein D6785_08605 [Planctomycetota bacterium]|nr:MAG: hypothetical protein D6785_08605 [Planctomycetota bacterium]
MSEYFNINPFCVLILFALTGAMPMKKANFLGFSLFIFSFLSGFLGLPSIQADIIFLKNGNKIRGEILRQDNTWITVKVPYGTLRIAQKNIQKIQKEEKKSFLLKQAKDLKRLFALEAALEKLKELYQANPNSAQVQKELEDVYLKLAKDSLEKKRFYQAWALVKEGTKLLPNGKELAKEREKLIQLYQTFEKMLERGREACQKKEYRKALDLYQRVLEFLPERLNSISPSLAYCHFQIGLSYYRKMLYEKAFQSFIQALEFNPQGGSFLEIYMVSAALHQAWQYFQKKEFQKGEKLLKKSLYYSPNNPKLLFYLGRSYVERGKIEKAIQYYCKVLHIPVPKGRINFQKLEEEAAKRAKLQMVSSQKEDAIAKIIQSKDWKTIKTKNFIIYHKNDYIGQKVASLMESSFQNIRPTFTNAPSQFVKLCEVHIYPTAKEYQKVSHLPEWNPGVTRYQKAGGRLLYHRILTYQTARGLYKTILPHELGHVMLLASINYNSIPRWLNEGWATQMEYDYQKRYRQWKIKAAIASGQAMSLEKMFQLRKYPKTSQETSIFYAQAYSFVAFLLKMGGWNQLGKLAQTVRNQSSLKALETVYGIQGIKNWERRWKEFVLQKK